MDSHCCSAVNDAAMKLLITEIKLHINHKLYHKGALTGEMYVRARDLILKQDGRLEQTHKNRMIVKRRNAHGYL